jgi:hypothetical protein
MVCIQIPRISHLSCLSDNELNRWDDYHLGAIKLALSDCVRQRPQLGRYAV